MSLKQTIFSADDITKELVEVPEWGVKVEVRSMTAAERAKLGEGASKGDKTDVGLMYAMTVIATVYDQQQVYQFLLTKIRKPSFQRMAQ